MKRLIHSERSRFFSPHHSAACSYSFFHCVFFLKAHISFYVSVNQHRRRGARSARSARLWRHSGSDSTHIPLRKNVQLEIEIERKFQGLFAAFMTSTLCSPHGPSVTAVVEQEPSPSPLDIFGQNSENTHMCVSTKANNESLVMSWDGSSKTAALERKLPTDTSDVCCIYCPNFARLSLTALLRHRNNKCSGWGKAGNKTDWQNQTITQSHDNNDVKAHKQNWSNKTSALNNAVIRGTTSVCFGQNVLWAISHKHTRTKSYLLSGRLKVCT